MITPMVKPVNVKEYDFKQSKYDVAPRFSGWDFSMLVLVWVFWWFQYVGLNMGILVRLGLRYRLLWFWVFM